MNIFAGLFCFSLRTDCLLGFEKLNPMRTGLSIISFLNAKLKITRVRCMSLPKETKPTPFENFNRSFAKSSGVKLSTDLYRPNASISNAPVRLLSANVRFAISPERTLASRFSRNVFTKSPTVNASTFCGGGVLPCCRSFSYWNRSRAAFQSLQWPKKWVRPLIF